ncbi:MAG TPA: hypothetical protein VG537_08615 [Candidatus Kapabacteria bacterium]|jgi:hypothetical protein|nr:hypothetical protein [Candidatus Kapabacteria bacterium]
MTFADLVEEVRTLPLEEKVELKEVLEHELTDAVREGIYQGHLEAVREWESGKLKTYTNVDDFIRSLDEDE